jgi:hypothetical protein
MRLFLTLLACGPGAQPSPWSYDPANATEAPSLTPDEVQEAVATWVPRLYDIDMAPLYESWQVATAAGDEACPIVLDYGNGTSNWQGGCQASTGATFQGYSEYSDPPPALDADGWLISNRYVYALADVASPDGWTWSVNGYYANAEGSHTTEAEGLIYEEAYHARDLAATITWDGPGAEGTWLASGLSYGGAASWYAIEGDGRIINLAGSVSGMEGPVTAVAAANLQLLSTTWTGCPVNEPNGAVSVRDESGRWYEVIFDAPLEFTESTDLSPCDGCGTLVSEGVELGQVCVDLTELADREVMPW